MPKFVVIDTYVFLSVCLDYVISLNYSLKIWKVSEVLSLDFGNKLRISAILLEKNG